MSSFEKLNVLLVKEQVSLGTKQSALTVTADLAVVGAGTFSLDYTPEFTEYQLATGIMDQSVQSMGLEVVNVKASVPIVPTGSTTEPAIVKWYRACGYASTLATNKVTIVPSSVETDWKDLTAWEITGDPAAGDSLLTKAHSIMLDWKFAGEIGKPAIVEFTGMGVPDGAPAPATRDSGPYANNPLVIPSILKASTMTVGDKTVKVTKFGFEGGNEVKMVLDPANDHGYARASIRGRLIKWNATFFQSNLNPDSIIPIMANTTLSDLQITWGVAGSRTTFKSGTDKCQVTSVKKTAVDGLNMFECSGTIIGNALTIVLNDD